MVASKSIILPGTVRLTHDEACRLSDRAVASGAQSIILDLSRANNATTAAFARLVLLRRELLRRGRDVRLTGLHDQPAKLFEVHRLDSVLPRISELPSTTAAPSLRREAARHSSASHAFPIQPLPASYCPAQ